MTRKIGPNNDTLPIELPAEAVSITTLARLLGVSRQYVYDLVEKGAIRTVMLTGGRAVEPEEARRVLESAVKVRTRGGVKVRFKL
jgi:excisionase family DNA binding protein